MSSTEAKEKIMDEPVMEMPKYECHKIVHALKIKSVTMNDVPEHGGLLHIEKEGFGPIVISSTYWLRHRPEPGGYYVVYKDGYKSFFPAKAFEEGYTLIS